MDAYQRQGGGHLCCLCPSLLTHSCMKYGWCGLRRLCPTALHNDRNVWRVRHRAQTVMGPSLRLSSSSDINCNFAVLNYTTQHISIRLNTGRLSLAVSFLQSHLCRISGNQFNSMLFGSLYSYRIMAVKNIGIHYDSAYSLCRVTNPKLYTPESDWITAIYWGQVWEIDIHALGRWCAQYDDQYSLCVGQNRISASAVLSLYHLLLLLLLCCGRVSRARVSARAPQLPVDTGQDRMCGPSLPVCYVTCDVKWGVTWPIPVKITAQQVAVSVICNKWGAVGKVDMIHPLTVWMSSLIIVSIYKSAKC